MTRPDPLREAERLLTFAEHCSDSQAVREEIAESIRAAHRQGEKDAYDKMRLGVAIDMEVQEARAEGHRQGQESMRERAAKEFNDDYAYVNVAKTIRALEPETEGGW